MADTVEFYELTYGDRLDAGEWQYKFDKGNPVRWMRIDWRVTGPCRLEMRERGELHCVVRGHSVGLVGRWGDVAEQKGGRRR